MHPFELHGGTAIAMKGNDCVCVATDMRMGENKMTNIATNIPKVHRIDDKLFVGLCGFSCDTATLLDKIKNHKALYELREDRPLTPKVLSTLLSNMLYKRRFGPYFISPLVAGLDPITGEAFISSTDMIGSITEPRDFVTIGTGEEYALACCESFWRPDLTPDELTEATAQTMMAIIERDASSGWGAVVYTITKDGVTSRALKCRMD